jgi:large repetitive protein
MRRALAVLVALVLSTAAFAQSADQGISATDSPDPVIPGNNVTYTINLVNNGPDAASNGGANILLGGSLIPVSRTASAGFTCTPLAAIMSCTKTSFGPGETATVTVVAQVDPSRLNFPDGSVSATFTTSGVTADPVSGNNSVTVTTNYDSPQFDLSLTVSDAPDPVGPNQTITYTIPVTNAGPDTATSVNFNSFNNGTLKFQSVAVPSGWNCTPPAVGSTPTFTCTNPSFAPGTSNFTVVVLADAAVLGPSDGTVGTVFNVNGTGNDTNQANNSETENTAYVTPDADMGVSVTDSPDPVFPDGNITYTVQVTNNGPDAATNAHLNSFNNGTLRFQSLSAPAGWSCTPPAVGSAPTFTCTNPSFAAGGNITFTVVVQADDAILGINDGTVSTNFSANSSLTDPNNANDSETENTAYLTPDANMGVSVSDSPDPVSPDGNITYTVQVTNAGPDTAPNATLNLFNNGSLKFVSASAPAGWNCATPAVGATPTFTCTNPSFASGGNVSFTIVVLADDAVLGINDGTVSTAFTVGSGAADPSNPNNSETEDTAYVTPDAELAITNADSPDPVSPGGTITYTQIVTNNGPNAANATVSQILPGSVGFQSLSSPAGFSCTTPAVGASGTITCNNPSFASGGTGTFTLVVTVLASSGTVVDTVEVSSTLQDTIPANNSAQVTTTILAPVIADLALTKATGAGSAAPGSTLSYTITLTNNGPDAAANVVVTDNLPAELLFQSISTPAGFSCTTPAIGATGTITCTAATMASGTTVTFTLVVEVTGNAVGPINNNAGATSSTQDNNPGNSSGGATPVTIGGSGTADLAITKTTPTTTAAPGSTVVYTISTTNNGPNTATNVVVTDTLPASLRFQSIAPAATFTCTTPAVGSSGTITCTGGPLANGATATFTLTTTIAPGATGSITNTASAGSNASDPNGSNSDATTPGIAVASADLSIAKTTAATQAPTGSTITYTITVTNHGPDAATGVVVTDNLPSGLQFVSATPSQGSCSGTDPFTCNLGGLANGSSATITLQALVTATGGTIANTASVIATTDDGNPGNDSSTSPSTPVVPGAAEAEIPTLSEWMLLMMAALLGLAAFMKMR